MAHTFPSLADAKELLPPRRTDFERLLVKTRFETHTGSLWKRLATLKGSVLHDMKRAAGNRSLAAAHLKKEAAENLLTCTKAMTGTPGNQSIPNWISYAVKQRSHLDGLFRHWLNIYTEEVDSNFDRTFYPNDFRHTIMEGAISKLKLKQDAVIQSIEDKIDILNGEIGKFSRHGAPNKNLWLHAALMIVAELCEPNYDNELIDNILEEFEKGNDAFGCIKMKDVIFRNNVVFSNEDCRTIYEMTGMMGFINKDEEWNGRRKANYITSAWKQTSNIGMVCLYESDFGFDSGKNSSENMAFLHETAFKRKQ